MSRIRSTPRPAVCSWITFDEVLGAVVDATLGPKRFTCAAFLVGTSRGKYPRTRAPPRTGSPSCRCRSCPRGRAPTRRPFSRPRSNTLVHTVKNVSGIAPAAMSRATPGPAGTAARAPHTASRNLLRYERAHAIAGRQPSRRPDARRPCRQPRVRECRWRRRRRIAAAPLHHVGAIDAGGRDSNEDLASAGHGIWTFDRSQHLRAAGGRYFDHSIRS